MGNSNSAMSRRSILAALAAAPGVAMVAAAPNALAAPVPNEAAIRKIPLPDAKSG